MKPIDAIGRWILKRASVKNQMRAGVIMSLVSLALFPLQPIIASGEPPVVYYMSAFAITITGFTMVSAAAPSETKGTP